MTDFVRNVDMMRRVDGSAAPLHDMIANNDLQCAVQKLRDDMRVMDRDTFMVELGEVQRDTANTPTHIVMRPIIDETGALRGKDIALATTGVDFAQNPVDCNIPIGQVYNDRCLPYQQPIVVRPDCAFELSRRPGDGWYHSDSGTVFFGGAFADGRVHLDFGRLDVDVKLGGRHEPRFYEGADRRSNIVIEKTEIINRTTNITKNVNENTTINNVRNNTVNNDETKVVNKHNDDHHQHSPSSGHGKDDHPDRNAKEDHSHHKKPDR